MFGEIAGIGDALKLGKRLVAVLERLSTDPDVKRKIQTNGRYSGELTLGQLKIEFDIVDMEKTAIPAEIEEVA